MTSPPSGSNQALSAAFTSFHPVVQRWIWDKGWPELRAVQEQAAPAVLSGRDVIITAATASGKTEAAWLPICSDLATLRENGIAPTGVAALYLAPLKALINDQHTRLDDLCETLDIPVHRWHGDVPGSRKQAVLSRPDGLLLITPESLEALFVNRGHELKTLFNGLRYLVIDELHAFFGSERGAQLQSLAHRTELLTRRRIPRIALSATLGEDLAPARDFLRPGHGNHVTVVSAGAGGGELKIQLRGHLIRAMPTPAIATASSGGEPSNEEDEGSDVIASIADHLFRTLRGQDNLVFANARRRVEQLTDALTRRSEASRVPNEFVAHHGSLSRDLREDAEARLKDTARPTTAICTSTLEMGIDIGSVDSIAQIGAPPSVSGLRQRLGRSGRRRGQAAVLRAYISEPEIDPRTPLTDELRTELVQTIAMVQLLLRPWYETPSTRALHLSTLTQQILSVIAQHGDAQPRQLYDALCGHGPFRHVQPAVFTRLLRSLGQNQLLTQERNGALSLGATGERIVNHYSFYAAFQSSEEYRLIGDGRPIGSLPIGGPLTEGSLLIFAGRRWRILSVDATKKVIELARARGGRAPAFHGTGPTVDDRVRDTMRAIYESDDVPAYLDATAQELLREGRDTYRRRNLATHPITGTAAQTSVLPWCGDTIMSTLAVLLGRTGLRVSADGVALTVAADPVTTWQQIRRLAATEAPDPVNLAADVKIKLREKYDPYLDEELLNESYAAAAFDVSGAMAALRALATGPRPLAIDAPEPLADGHDAIERDEAAALADAGYAVLDVETTGFAAHRRDSIIEIAVVHVEPDGRVSSEWSTLLNPDRDTGPTHIHGITPADVAGAPRFTDIAGDLSDQLSGRVIVAHNALFDLTFLYAEYRRSGLDMPPWPTLCTLDAAYLLRPDGPRRLADCCAAEKIALTGAHTALGDASATARLLSCYLAEARASGYSLTELGCRPPGRPPRWAPATPSRRSQHRRAAITSQNTAAGFTTRVALTRVGTAADDAYLDVLDRALADLHLSDEELDDLASVASAFGLNPERVAALQRSYLTELATVADRPTVAALSERLISATHNHRPRSERARKDPRSANRSSTDVASP